MSLINNERCENWGEKQQSRRQTLMRSCDQRAQNPAGETWIWIQTEPGPEIGIRVVSHTRIFPRIHCTKVNPGSYKCWRFINAEVLIQDQQDVALSQSESRNSGLPVTLLRHLPAVQVTEHRFILVFDTFPPVELWITQEILRYLYPYNEVLV